jgi:hypothetical protein
MSLNETNSLENTKDVGGVIAQSLLWSAMDPTYDGIITSMKLILVSESGQCKETLLNALVVLFACPDVELAEQCLIPTLSVFQNQLEHINIIKLLGESDFWIIFVYFGLNSTSIKVIEILDFFSNLHSYFIILVIRSVKYAHIYSLMWFII